MASSWGRTGCGAACAVFWPSSPRPACLSRSPPFSLWICTCRYLSDFQLDTRKDPNIKLEDNIENVKKAILVLLNDTFDNVNGTLRPATDARAHTHKGAGN
jgi:hypothetical protein